MSFLFHLLSFDIAKIPPVLPTFQTFFHKTPKTHQTMNGISDKRPNHLFFLSDFIKKKPSLLEHCHGKKWQAEAKILFKSRKFKLVREEEEIIIKTASQVCYDKWRGVSWANDSGSRR